METTKPKLLLYVDAIEKSISREQAKAVHKDLPKGGTWRTMRGHHIYIVNGKVVAGSIPGMTGKAKKASKDDLAGHQATLDKEAKKSRSKSAKKGATTKASNKVNATGKAGKETKLDDLTGKKTAKKPTSEAKATAKKGKKTTSEAKPKKATAWSSQNKETKPEKVRTKKASAVQNAREKNMRKKASEEKRAIRQSKKERDMTAPVLKRNTTHREDSQVQEVKGTIDQKNTQKPPKSVETQNQALMDYAKLENENGHTTTINDMWNHPEVQKLLKKPANKRSIDDINKVAGAISTANDKLARHLVLKMGNARGLNLAHQVNRIGNKATPSDKVKVQETNHYGDLLQTARTSMYGTLRSLLQGNQTPREGTPIGAHVISRMKQDIHKDLHDVLNALPAPHAIRGAIADMKSGENELSQKLGRTPTHDELAQHLEKNSKHFKEAPIAPPAYYDEKAGQMVAPKGRIEDPSNRLKQLKIYADQQKVGTTDKNIGKEDMNEISGTDAIQSDDRSPEEGMIRKERQAELEDALPKAMSDMGLHEHSIKVLRHMFSQPSETTNKGQLTQDEVAQRINDKGGVDGKPISRQWVDKWYRAGMAKIAEAMKANHPALEKLRMLKSFAFNIMMKAFWEVDLVKSLMDWGIDPEVMEKTYVRATYADDLYELQKSLAPYEYIGTVISVEGGGVHARVMELTVPEDDTLLKSFNDYLHGLQKSMFPHKGGTNHALNQKASEYVKANHPKYKALAGQQAHNASQKGKGQLTWSEKLLLDNPGSAWITWGGKKILMNVGSGQVIYDSANSEDRDKHNGGAQEAKIDFHHEKEALDQNEEERGAKLRKEWDAHISSKEKNAGKKTFDYQKEREAFAKKNPGVSFDEEGKFHFTPDSEVTDENRHVVDHGVNAFRQQMEDMRDAWQKKDGTKLVGGVKKDFLDNHSHKALDAYAELSPEEREAMNGMSHDDKVKFLGKHLLSKDGVQEALQKYHDAYKSGENPSEAEDELREKLKSIGSVAGRNTAKMDTFLKDVQKLNPSAGDNMDELEEKFGSHEMSRAREEAGKNLIPEGTYTIGNPVTGKSMVVKIGGDFSGGRAGKGGKYASVIQEAFDPDGNEHFEPDADGHISWGQLGKALGYKGKDADNVKAILTQHANTDPDKPFMKQMSEQEFNAHRANTKLGLQESMAHKNFKLVKESRDKDGNVSGRTYAQDMPDGTQNVFELDGKGYLRDPIMARLVRQKAPIESVDDLHNALRNAVGNRAWVTAHIGSDIHVGDALGHHVQLEYDGKGAPRVVGGKYAGYRFMDEKDVPKGAIDPATGEPIKALFKNGKLKDRRFTTTNNVDIKEGNAVQYHDGRSWKKGKIVGKTPMGANGGGDWIVRHADGTQAVYKHSELKNATEKGRTLAEHGGVAVRVGQTGTHRMDMDKLFSGGENKRAQNKLDKARGLMEEALRKAHVSHEGGQLELSDAQHRRLTKVLGKSKAGKELLKQFNSAYTQNLEVHVPNELKDFMKSEGVTVHNSGVAKISVGKFEQLRDSLAQGGHAISLDHHAEKFLRDHFNRKDRKPKTKEELQKGFQPSMVSTGNRNFDQHYASQFKPSSFLMDKSKGLYGTQLEGVSHLVERGRGIVGHGMGVGKTITGVVAGLHYKAQKLANNEVPKKTLVVSPKGIMSDWGKEIGGNTNAKALYVGSGLTKKGADGKAMKHENGRNMFGQDGTEQESVTAGSFLKNMDKHASEDHDFHIMSYDTFMKNRDALAKSGLYDNIVIDEVHAFKNQQGERGKSLAETTNHFQNVWGLSGTPMENDAREIYSLVDTITGGKHELGTKKEFQDNYMMKDKNGKITGIKPSKEEKLGDILANLIQFRAGHDVTYNDGSKIHFPQLVGQEPTKDNPNPHVDFIGDMADGNRDHRTTDYYGTKHSVTDYELGKEFETADGGTSQTFIPKKGSLDPATQKMYDRYNELQNKYLPESKLNELATASATGYDTGKQGKSNYLTAMQKLQKFLNAPDADKMYVPGGGTAIESDATDVQGAGKKKAEPIPHVVDSDGNKRYYEADGQGGFKKNADGSPKLLDPLHHNNPKAQYLKKRLSRYLDSLARENSQRRKDGRPELMPKVVLKSSYTTFGTDIMEGVLRDLQKQHPELLRWQKKVGDKFGFGRFTGDADDREDTKVGFRGNKNDYASNQGHLWATTVSPAGKEGVDFGNAHAMFHYDQDWNPQKMAQFTARVRRSDSKAKGHDSVDRANAVRVESLHMPGTVEDFMFNAEDSKMRDINKVTNSTRQAEESPRYGETATTPSNTARDFTRGSKRKAGVKPKNAQTVRTPEVRKPTGGAGSGALPKGAVASPEKALKLVILM